MQILLVRGRRAAGALERYAFHVGKLLLQKRIGRSFYPVCNVRFCRTPMRRVVFKAAALRWIVRRRDNNPVGEA